MRRAGRWALLAVALAMAACGAHGPHVAVAKLADLPRPLPRPYDETATPAAVDARIDAAFAEARATHRRVVVDLGGNWCSWCRMLAAVMEQPEARPWIAANFVVVPVEIASVEGAGSDRNLQVLRRFGIAKVDGVPWLVVADPGGRVLASSDAVTDDAHHTPQAMLDWLAQFAIAPAR